MSLEIYPQDFTTRYEMRHAISVTMTVYYNAVGKITVSAVLDQYNVAALACGNLIYDTVRNAAFLIVNIKIDSTKNQITANGYTTNWLLNQRVTADVEYHIHNVEEDTYALIKSNLRGLPGIDLAPTSGISAETDTVAERGYLLDTIMPVLEEHGLGNRMEWDADTLTHVFRIYNGRDLTTGNHAVVFSDEQGTAPGLVINDDLTTIRNVAYVSIIDGETETVHEIGTATGGDRREIWLPLSVTREDGETEQEFAGRIEETAAVELGQYIRRQSFQVSADPEDVGVRYDLGDVVACSSARFGISFNARVTCIKYTSDKSKTTTQITLGDPILTALGEMKLNG